MIGNFSFATKQALKNLEVKDEYYHKFPEQFDLTYDAAFDLMGAANYLGIQSLLELVCLWLTYEMKDKSVVEVSTSTSIWTRCCCTGWKCVCVLRINKTH